MNYKTAASYIIKRRKRDLDSADVLFLDALKLNPQLLDVERELRRISLLEAKGERFCESIKQDLHCQKSALLSSMGITDSMLFPAPHCDKCNDSARLGDGYCDCVRIMALNTAENLGIDCKRFSEIDFDRFDQNVREHIRSAYGKIQKITELYPNNQRRIITLQGPTGTGKTLLAGCAASEMLRRCFSVVVVPAHEMQDRFRNYHLDFTLTRDERDELLDSMLDPSFLVIDDLGTETFSKTFTAELLFKVIYERLKTNKLTLITTNLHSDAIKSRYSERIFSRLYDREKGYVVAMNGEDMRLNFTQKKENNHA